MGTRFQEVREEFDGEYLKKGRVKLGLSAAVAAGRSVMQSYNISALARYQTYCIS